MGVALRLSRGGSKKRPFFRIVAADVRSPRDGRFLERLGTYNPMMKKDDPQRITLNSERIKYWLSVGAKPSERVQKGNFGVCLMLEPDLVAECTRKMSKSVDIPVTVKCRTGVNDNNDYEFLKSFISTVKDSGVKTFIIHARKALLGKFTPKQNLNIPPLKYEFVYKLKEDFPNEEIIINGGITSVDQIKPHLEKTDGVMIGRAAYHTPYFLADIEKDIFKNEDIPSRQEVIENLIPYIKDELKKGTRLNQIMRHTLGLFHGQSGASYWKRYLSKNMCVRDADVQKIDHIMDKIKYNNVERRVG